jgi:hypothetical protein
METPNSLDERLKLALDYGNRQVTALTQRENLKMRTKAMLLHSRNGGVFHVGIELINFVDLMVRRGETELVLFDSKENPVRLTDLPQFLDEIIVVYHDAMNEYHLGYQKLRKKRSVEAMVDLA